MVPVTFEVSESLVILLSAVTEICCTPPPPQKLPASSKKVDDVCSRDVMNCMQVLSLHFELLETKVIPISPALMR